jgi:hypothetical protein
MRRVILFAIAGCMIFASPVMAKEGFYLGLFYPTEAISGDAGRGANSGGGWGVRLGSGFNRYLSLEGHYSSTSHNSADLNGLAADLKLNFPLTSLDTDQIMTVEPYIIIGYGHYEFGKSSKVKSDGVQYGFGVELYLFRELSVQAGWTKTSVSFDSTPKSEGDVKTLDLGLIYHFI